MGAGIVFKSSVAAVNAKTSRARDGSTFDNSVGGHFSEVIQYSCFVSLIVATVLRACEKRFAGERRGCACCTVVETLPVSHAVSADGGIIDDVLWSSCNIRGVLPICSKLKN